ncbi:MAG: hypothetical protein AB7F40_10710 [Victivallaceae bacterium]
MRCFISKRSGGTVLLAGLLVVLAVAGTSAFTVQSAPIKDQPPDIASLDRIAQQHFDQAEANIPTVVTELSTPATVMKLAWLMAYDHIAGTRQMPDYVQSALAPIIQPCRTAARVYGLDMDSAALCYVLTTIEAENAVSVAYSGGGIALDALFIRATIASLQKVLAAVVARMTICWSTGGTAAILDGPFPFGDAVGIVVAGCGTVWCGYDLYQSMSLLPEAISEELLRTVRTLREACHNAALKEVQP